MGFQSLIEDGHPLNYLFRTLIRDQRKQKTSKLSCPDTKELLLYIQSLEKHNKKLQKYEAEYKIREKRDDINRNYKMKITPSDGKSIKYTAEGSFKKMISIIKNWDDFKDDEIKSFEMTLATYGYLFCNTEKINISVLEVT